MKCQVPGCKRKHRAKGLCESHYKILNQTGFVSAQARRKGACTVEGCHLPRKARGWCHKHWQRWNKWGDPTIDNSPKAAPCSQEGCERKSEAYGLCRTHYDRMRHGRPLEGTDRKRGKCAICPKPHFAKGLCRLHWQRWRKTGDPWFDGKHYPKPKPHYTQPMGVDLPVAPLLELIESVGGFAEVCDRVGWERESLPRNRAEKNLDRAERRGTVDLAVADEICCKLLRLHPALVWPEDYWQDEEEYEEMAA